MNQQVVHRFVRTMNSNSPWRKRPMCSTARAKSEWRGERSEVSLPLSQEKVVRIFKAEGRQVDIAKAENVGTDAVWRIKKREYYRYWTEGL